MTIYNESFTGTAGAALATYNPTFVFVSGDGAAYYGLVGGTAGGTLFTGTQQKNIFRYNAAVGADQFGEFVVEGTGTQFDTGIKALLVLRSSTDANPNHDHYHLEVQDNGANGAAHNFLIFKVVNGTPTQIGATFTHPVSNGNVVRFEATGAAPATLVTKVNGTQIDSRTDSTSPHTSGQLGIGGSKTSGLRMASWSGGDLSAASDLSGTAIIGAVVSAGTIAPTAASTLTGTAVLGGVVSTGSITSGVGTFTSQPLARNNDSPVASSALTWLSFRNATTGVHVLLKTGVSTDSSSIFTVSDVALLPGTAYRADWLEASGQHGHGVATAT